MRRRTDFAKLLRVFGVNHKEGQHLRGVRNHQLICVQPVINGALGREGDPDVLLADHGEVRLVPRSTWLAQKALGIRLGFFHVICHLEERILGDRVGISGDDQGDQKDPVLVRELRVLICVRHPAREVNTLTVVARIQRADRAKAVLGDAVCRIVHRALNHGETRALFFFFFFFFFC